MKKTKLFYYSLIASLLVSGLTLNTANSNAQETESGYSEDTDGTTIYYEEGTKLSDIYNVNGIKEIKPVTDIYDNKISPLNNWLVTYFDPIALYPGIKGNVLQKITYSSKETVKIQFKSNKNCDIVVGLNYDNDTSVYATQKVSCKANVLNTVSFILEKDKSVYPFFLNISNINVELRDIALHTIYQ